MIAEGQAYISKEIPKEEGQRTEVIRFRNPNKKVKFIISMAGPGIPIDELLVLQTNAIAKVSGATEEEVNSGEATNRKIYALLIVKFVQSVSFNQYDNFLSIVGIGGIAKFL